MGRMTSLMYEMETNPAMFETTNQLCLCLFPPWGVIETTIIWG